MLPHRTPVLVFGTATIEVHLNHTYTYREARQMISLQDLQSAQHGQIVGVSPLQEGRLVFYLEYAKCLPAVLVPSGLTIPRRLRTAGRCDHDRNGPMVGWVHTARFASLADMTSCHGGVRKGLCV